MERQYMDGGMLSRPENTSLILSKKLDFLLMVF